MVIIILKKCYMISQEMLYNNYITSFSYIKVIMQAAQNQLDFVVFKVLTKIEKWCGNKVFLICDYQHQIGYRTGSILFDL